MKQKRDALWLKKFCAHLVKIMEKQGVSQRKLAALSGVSLSKINKLVQNDANLNITTLRKLAEGLDIHPKELLDFEWEG